MAAHVRSVTPRSAVAITKSDTTTYDGGNGGKLDGFYVGGAGDVAVVTLNAETVTFSAVPAGTVIPIKCTKIMSTNTTATLILGLRY